MTAGRYDEDLPPALARLLAEVDGHRDGFPTDFVRRVARTGVPGGLVAQRYGGLALGHACYGRLNRAVAEVSPALQSLFTVHGMVCRAVSRWGGAALREAYLPELASGRLTASFALSEAAAGSDIRGIQATARPVPGGWVLRGGKQWVTFGETADLFLVFAKAPDGDLAVLVRPGDPGVRVHPAPATSGFAGSRLADVDLVDCEVPDDRRLGRPGTALSHIATDALLVGRLCVAHGAWGLARSALAAAVERATGRRQFDAPLHSFQLVRGLLADAALATEAAGLLCQRAAQALDERAEWAVHHVLTAKLAATRAATTAAAAAAQIHGAAGLVDGSTVDRQVRDARVMEIIEGSTQLVQHLIADQLLARFRAGTAAARTAVASGG
jgi:alkylation response protein AidB-like acyl-CoA dehydrogenase